MPERFASCDKCKNPAQNLVKRIEGNRYGGNYKEVQVPVCSSYPRCIAPDRDSDDEYGGTSKKDDYAGFDT